MIGYQKPLFILPFDHRTSFVEKLFGFDMYNLQNDQAQKVKDAKKIVYEGFEKALATIPKDTAAILVDEQFGSEILHDAKEKGYITILTTEKSGQNVFDFEYGEQFGDHIREFQPTFVKALLRYNTEGNTEQNAIQRQRLKTLSDFCTEHVYKFLIEPLVTPTDEQLARVMNDKNRYDSEIRPPLTVQMIKEFQDSGIEVDVWKIEGMNSEKDYEAVVQQARSPEPYGTGRSGERNEVGIVVLGRAESIQHVEEWIRKGSRVKGVIGFAVGRTIFWEPLFLHKEKRISRNDAVGRIAEGFIHFYNVFNEDTHSTSLS